MLSKSDPITMTEKWPGRKLICAYHTISISKLNGIPFQNISWEKVEHAHIEPQNKVLTFFCSSLRGLRYLGKRCVSENGHPVFCRDRKAISFYYLLFIFLMFIWERERASTHACTSWRGAEREGQRKSQAGSMLSAEHDTGLNLTTVRNHDLSRYQESDA